jgi:deoxyribodipyrimidine photo-lyase
LKRVKKFNTVNALFPSGERTTSVHSFCEELVVRKELSDNFCFYNDNYSTITGAHNWAQTTLQEHWDDPREVLYSEEQLEGGLTADHLWNAAQLEMVNTGKMHGFMRMYWAKKVPTLIVVEH